MLGLSSTHFASRWAAAVRGYRELSLSIYIPSVIVCTPLFAPERILMTF